MSKDLRKFVKFLIFKSLSENYDLNYNDKLNEKSNDLILYHGSNKSFNSFDDNKLGSGEGGNLFGKGFYLTDSEEIAKFYAKVVSKKDHITGYKQTGIFGTNEPIYKTDADELSDKNIHINKFSVNGNILDVENYIIDNDFKKYIIWLMEKNSGFGKSSRSIAERTFDYLRNNKNRISHYRGELEYIIQHLGMGDENFVEGIKNYIIKMGYDGVKYPSDKSYEGSGAFNYVIYNKNVIKSTV